MNTLFGQGDRYGYKHDWFIDEENGKESSGYSIYTEELFDGFVLPHGLAFGDSMKKVCNKLSLSASPLENFTPDSELSPYLMTMRKEVGTSLTFENLAINPHVQTTLPYRIIYTEATTQTNDAGEDIAITREVSLYFNEDGNFVRISFKRSEIRYFVPETNESTESTAE